MATVQRTEGTSEEENGELKQKRNWFGAVTVHKEADRFSVGILVSNSLDLHPWASY